MPCRAATVGSSCPPGQRAGMSLLPAALCQLAKTSSDSPECLWKSQEELNWEHRMSRGGVLTCEDLEMVLFCVSWWAWIPLSKSSSICVETAVKRLQCSCFVTGVFTLSAFSIAHIRRSLQFLTVNACFLWGLRTSTMDDAFVLLLTKCFPVTC